MYWCNVCTKMYKTSNGGVQNLRNHLITVGKKGRDKKRKSQLILENISIKQTLEKNNNGKKKIKKILYKLNKYF